MSGTPPPPPPPVVPFPVSLTNTGFSLASGSFDGIESVPDLIPVEPGLNRTNTAQDAPGARVTPEQPSVPFENAGPAGEIVLTVKLAVPSFWTVTAFSEVV